MSEQKQHALPVPERCRREAQALVDVYGSNPDLAGFKSAHDVLVEAADALDAKECDDCKRVINEAARVSAEQQQEIELLRTAIRTLDELWNADCDLSKELGRIMAGLDA